MLDLEGPVFFSLVNRLSAYRGVIREIALADQETDHGGEPVQRVDSSSRGALESSDLGQLIEFD